MMEIPGVAARERRCACQGKAKNVQSRAGTRQTPARWGAWGHPQRLTAGVDGQNDPKALHKEVKT